MGSLAAQVGLHCLALLVYPGGLALLAFGLPAQLAADRLARRRGRRAVLPGAAWPPAAAAVALLALLAASQIAVPFNPVQGAERNALVAALALASATWLGAAGVERNEGFQPGLTLLAQACWMVALLAPAMSAGTLQPSAVAVVALPAQLPLKVAGAVVCLLCLPAVLQLLPETTPAGLPSAARALVWLPACGLFASLFFAPAGDDVGGLLRFVACTAAAAAAAIGLAWALERAERPRVRRFYVRLVLPLTGLVVLLAVLTAV
jgi:hypothetical protein